MQRKIEVLEAAAAAAAIQGRLDTWDQTLMSGAVGGNATHDTEAMRKDQFQVQRGGDPGVRGAVAERRKASPSPPQKEVSAVHTARPRDSRREGPKAELRRPSALSKGRTLVIIMGLHRGNIGVSPFAVRLLFKLPFLSAQDSPPCAAIWGSLVRHVLEPLGADLATYFGRSEPQGVLRSIAKYSWTFDDSLDWESHLEQAIQPCNKTSDQAILL